uniref:CKLF-like MARVEL transmembrane domain-containing protein 7 isoform X2 n=1 Tax=Myxine glutinosa TaxID=7769 RepID=UPI00358E75AA
MSSNAAYSPTTTSPNPVQTEPLYDKVYPKTTNGLVKIVQMVLLMIAFLCVATHAFGNTYFQSAMIWWFFMALIFFLLYFFRVPKRVTFIHWPLTELIFYVIGTIFVLTASITLAANTGGYAVFIVGLIFGFMATVAFAYNGWLAFSMWRTPSSQPATV